MGVEPLHWLGGCRWLWVAAGQRGKKEERRELVPIPLGLLPAFDWGWQGKQLFEVQTR